MSWLHISIDQFGNVGTPLAMLFTLAFILAMALYFRAGGLATGQLGAGLPGLGGCCCCPPLDPGGMAAGLAAHRLPWLALGYSQVDAPLGGYAPLLGVYGVSGLLALSAALLLQLVQPGRQRLLWGGLLLALWLGGGLLRRVSWTQPSGAPLEVGLVQANIPGPQVGPGDAPGLHRPLPGPHRAHWGKRLLIWPETAVPDFLHRVLEPLLEPWPRRLAAMGAACWWGSRS